MNGRRSFGLSTAIAGGALVIAGLFVTPGDASATSVHKVTICHATHSETNPYVKETVAYSAVDGVGRNDHSHHTGPLWYLGAKGDGVTWGDIIPPVAHVTAGMNWTAAGRAMLRNGCTPLVVPTTTTTVVPNTLMPPDTTPLPPDTTLPSDTTVVPNTLLPPDTTVVVTTVPPDTTAVATTTTELGGEEGTTTSVASEAPTTTVAGALPSTGGSDGILIAIGALMVLVGAVTLVLGRHPDEI